MANSIFNKQSTIILCGDWPEGLLKPGGSPTHSREHQTRLQVRLQENGNQEFFLAVRESCSAVYMHAHLWYA